MNRFDIAMGKVSTEPEPERMPELGSENGPDGLPIDALRERLEVAWFSRNDHDVLRECLENIWAMCK